MSSPLVVKGKRAWAVRSPDKRYYLLIPIREQSLANPTTHIYEFVEGQERTVSTLPSSLQSSFPLSFSLPLEIVLLLSILFLFLGGIGITFEKGTFPPPLFLSSPSVPSFIGMGIAFLLTLFLLPLMEGGILAGYLASEEGYPPSFGFSYGIPSPERVFWHTGVPIKFHLSFSFFLFSLFFLAGSTGKIFPATSTGIQMGTLLYGIRTLYPLLPSLGSSLWETLFKIKPPLKILKTWWHFSIPTIQVGEGSIQNLRSALFLLTFLWFLWILSVGGVVFLLWDTPFTWIESLFLPPLLFTTFLPVFHTWRERKETIASRSLPKQTVISPTPPLRDSLMGSSLLTHIPSLKEGNWIFLQVEGGETLIRQGSSSRHFYWLIEGEVEVLIRREKNPPLRVATLKSEVGFGEIALLTGSPRTADVIVTETSLLAQLPYEEFLRIKTETVEERLFSFVKATQSFHRSPLFSDFTLSEREKWLQKGEILSFEEGEWIITEGEMSRWMGLIVDGEVEVIRGGKTIAHLKTDEIVGEMAFLRMDVRSAGVRAVKPTRILKWDPEYLEEAIPPPLWEKLKGIMEKRLKKE